MARQDKIGRHRTVIYSTLAGGEIHTIVRYHETPVVIVTPTKIILNTGGWRTPTTKTRMNQAANQWELGYSVYQHKGEWYVDYAGETRAFEGDSIELEIVDGTIVA